MSSIDNTSTVGIETLRHNYSEPTMTLTSEIEDSSARGRQRLTSGSPTHPTTSILTPPHSRSNERKHSTPASEESSPSSENEKTTTLIATTNNYQTITLMPELVCEYSCDEEQRSMNVRHIITTAYRKQKYNESKAFIHKTLSGDTPASFFRVRHSLSEEAAASDLQIKISPRKIEGPEVDAEDSAIHIAEKLIESTAPLLKDQQPLQALALCNDCVSFYIQTLNSSLNILKEMHDLIHHTHFRGNRRLSIQEYRQWKYSMDDLLCEGGIHEKMKRLCLNEFVVWVLVCRNAWRWRGADDFLKALGKDMGGKLMVECGDKEYDIEIGDGSVEKGGRCDATQ